MSPTLPSSRLPDLTGAFVDEGYLQLGELLACGGFAKVYKALDTTSSPEDPVFYAAKCMRNGAPGSLLRSTLRNEFSMHMAVTHQPGVVNFHHVFTDGPEGEFVFMILDLETDNMLDLIFRRHIYVDRPALVKVAFLEVLDAVAQCHDDGVFHRDLKPQNILCTSRGTGIRLADFGFATREEESTTFRAGTLAYMSPECTDSSRVSYSPRESDLWALAVLLLNLSTGTIPWFTTQPSDPKFAAYRADEDNYLVNTLHLTRAAADFFWWCFTADPAGRPNLQQMRDAVLNIERFSLADMLPRAVKSAPVAVHPPVPPAEPCMLNLSDILSESFISPTLPPLISDIPCPASASSATSGATHLSTPPASNGHPSPVVVDLLDTANVGFAAVHPPPLIPTKLHAHTPVRSPPIKMAPEYRFLDRRKRNIATRQRFAEKIRRV
ncbi:kinase-like domain-containing protein [Mycena alexandri]|uniref:Kinase-like domain-containing protein n=1 Tax=Mycena alexandri TaxID=1745969 RepID=A0AAD6SDI2_9AGAR|nr:kinase-like domain-containing protein [Mycena alexandri]